MRLINVIRPSFVAITFGQHVFTNRTYLRDMTIWHEECHTKQYKKYGFFGFLVRYLWDSLKHGYWNNKFEVEARKYALLTAIQRAAYIVQ